MAKLFNSRFVGAERLHSLTDFDESIRAKLAQVIEAKARELLSGMRSKVSGGVLHVRKGRLLNSLDMQTYETANGPGARIFSRWYIARFYEQGFGGKTFDVKGHVRRVKARNVRAKVLNEKTGKTSNRKAGQGIAFVKAHNRNIPRTQKSFMKSTLEQHRAEIRSAMLGAVNR
jgi:hypothetical protein